MSSDVLELEGHSQMGLETQQCAGMCGYHKGERKPTGIVQCWPSWHNGAQKGECSKLGIQEGRGYWKPSLFHLPGPSS